MELPTYFTDFLSEIRLTAAQVDDLKQGHRVLRERLEANEDLASIIVSTFLQGSYRRATAVRPKGEERADVDVIVVTTLDSAQVTPSEALERFTPFLDKHYAGKYRVQGRSIGINLSYVDLDVVITAAPSESNRALLKSDSVTAEGDLVALGDWRPVRSWVDLDHRDRFGAGALMKAAAAEPTWQAEPLLIPDHEAHMWQRTHPLLQISWTWEKNASCGGHYVNVVKALKWWRRISSNGARPKGYPVEHLIGMCCPDGVSSVAEGVTKSLERIATGYADLAQRRESPFLPDHGVPEHNVFKRVSGAEFATFHAQIVEAAAIAREAFDARDVETSARAWGRLFGSKFPTPPAKQSGSRGAEEGGYTPRTEVTTIAGGRYA